MEIIELFEATFSGFHGTSSPVDFAAFSLDHSGKVNPSWEGQSDFPAIWASERPEPAAFFAKASPQGFEGEVVDGSRVAPVHVHLDNPLTVDCEAERDVHRSDKYINRPEGRLWNIGYLKNYYLQKAHRLGHDGVIFTNGYDGWAVRGDIYAVFDPNDIQFKFGKTE